MADMNRDDFLDLIPAYALGALDDDERAAFEARLLADLEAQRLLDEYRAVADALVLLTPAQPAPPGLADDLRRRLAAQRSAPEPQPASTRTALPRRILALAAALALVFGALWLALNGGRAGETMPPDQMFSELLARPDAVRVALVSAAPFEDVYGELIAVPDGGYAVIKVDCLPQLEAGQAFQLWLTMAEGVVVSGGMFYADPDSETTYVPVTFSQPLARYRRLAVSIEPQTGSARPAGPPVFAVPLA